MSRSNRASTLSVFALITALALAGCGGEDLAENSSPPDGGSQTPPDGGTAQCKAAPDCPEVSCHCGDGTTIKDRACTKGVCATQSACTSVCAGHLGGTDGGSGTDAGSGSTCDDNFRTGTNAVQGNDVYVACNSNPAKGQPLPTNCETGRFILFDTPQLCYCMLGCSDFKPVLKPGEACSSDGKFICRRVKNKSGNVNDLCLPKSWDDQLCKAP